MMKFKEMSLEDLEKDFINFLNSKDDKELIDSLENYIEYSNEYYYTINEDNNLEEKFEFDNLEIVKTKKIDDAIAVNNEPIDVDEDSSELEGAA